MGFFKASEVRSVERVDGRVQSCASCGLYKKVESPRMEPFGNFKKGILNVGEAPGEVEDEKGRQWQGKVGRMLKRKYRGMGIDLFEDCLNINAVNCRPVDEEGGNRAPSLNEISCCRRKVYQVIKQYKPKLIVALGRAAIVSLVGSRLSGGGPFGITRWRGWTIPDREFGCWIVPVFHPSYVQRMDEFPEVECIWEQDLDFAFGCLQKPLPAFQDEEQQVVILETQSEINGALNSLSQGPIPPDPKLLAIDYETTGLKPHDTTVHKIMIASFCDSPHRVYVFLVNLRRRRQMSGIRKVLQSPFVGKTAHNMKFEQMWTYNIFGYDVYPWVWDSMQAAHILDNRVGISGLKMQTYIHFGVPDYDSDVGPYLRAVDEKDGNSVNRLEELLRTPHGRQRALTYCGMDGLFNYRLALMQMEQMGIDLDKRLHELVNKSV